MEKKRTKIVVVIPARNEEAFIEVTIQAVKNQGYPELALVVVDSASTDNTALRAAKHTPHVVRLTEKGVARARNAGAAFGKTLDPGIFVFIDADTHMGPQLLHHIEESVTRKNNVAGSCNIRLDQKHWRARLTVFILNMLQRIHRSPHALMYATPEVVSAIPFDETMVMAEDEKWAYMVMKRFGMRRYHLITSSHVITSARRFEKHGYLNILYKWWTSLPFSLSTQKKEASYFD